MEDSRGRKLGDTQQILVLHIFGGVQAAAGKKGILDAGGEHVTKAHFQIEIVQFFQQAVLHIVGQIGQMIPVDLVHRPRRQLHQLSADVAILGGTVLPLQCFHYGGVMILPHFPQVGRFCTFHRAGVRHVKDIFQRGSVPLVLADEGDALGTGLHPPPHGSVPQLHAGAGGGLRALGVDQELVIERIFVHLGRDAQIPLPVVYAVRDRMGGLICQIRYKLYFVCHENLLITE